MANANKDTRHVVQAFFRSALLSFQRLLKIEFAVAVVGAIAFVVALGTYLLVPSDPQMLADRFLPEAIGGVDIADSRPQRIAYQLFLAVLGIGAIVLAFLPAARRPMLQLTPILTAAVITVMVVNGPAIGARAFWYYVAGAVAILVAWRVARRPKFRWVVGVAIAAIFMVAIGPALFGTLVPSPLDVVGIDHHYNFMFSQARQLTAGYILSGDVAGYPPGYGALSQLLVGIAAELGQPVSFAGLVRIVQLGQGAFFLLFLGAVWLRMRDATVESRVLALFVASLLAAPWLYTLGLGIVRPNLSGFRFLMLAVAAVVAGLSRTASPVVFGVLVGATVGVALLFNLETGIAVTAGLGIAWLLRVRRETLRIATASAASGTAALLVALILFGALYWAFFGNSTHPATILFLFENILLFASGYNGLELPFKLVLIVILLHSGFILIKAIRSILNSRFTAPDLMDAAVATMLLAWMPYYLNRALDQTLYAILLLYVLLLLPALAVRGKRLAAILVVMLVVLPDSMRAAKENLAERDQLPGWVAGWQHGCADGLILPEDVCTRLNQRAETLRRFAEEEPVFWASSTSLFVLHMSGVRSLLWTGDLVPQVFTADDLARVVAKVERVKPRTLLLDDPPTAIQSRLAASLSQDYCPAGVDGGWRVYRRSDLCGNDGRGTDRPAR